MSSERTIATVFLYKTREFALTIRQLYQKKDFSANIKASRTLVFRTVILLALPFCLLANPTEHASASRAFQGSAFRLHSYRNGCAALTIPRRFLAIRHPARSLSLSKHDSGSVPMKSATQNSFLPKAFLSARIKAWTD